MAESADQPSKRGRFPTPRRLATDGLARTLQSDLVHNTVEDQLSVLVQQQFAKAQAMRFARQTDSVAAHAQFADGSQRWVIFNDETPIAAFPPYAGDLDAALQFHNLERLQMRQPSDLALEIKREREQRRQRWKIWARGGGEEREAVVEGLLELEAGDMEDA